MNNEYLLGKDIESLKAAVERIESRLDSLAPSAGATRRGPCDRASNVCRDKVLQFRTLQDSADAIPETKVPIHWRATDVHSTGKVKAPDGKAECVFQGLMIPKGTNSDEYTAIVLSEARTLCKEDRSATLGFSGERKHDNRGVPEHDNRGNQLGEAGQPARSGTLPQRHRG